MAWGTWSRRQRTAAVAAGAALVLAAGVAAVLVRPVSVVVAEVTPHEVRPAVYAVGTVEVKSVVQVSAKIAGRLRDVTVDQGHAVERGQLLARLDDGQQIAEVDRARGALEAVEAQLRDLQAGARPQEIAEARANVARARAQLDDLVAGARPQEIADARERLRAAAATRALAEREHDRARRLYERELIAAQEAERARQAHDVAAAQERAAEQALALVSEGPRPHQVGAAAAQVQAARDRLDLLLAGPRPHQVTALLAQAREARAALAAAAERLADTRITSPLEGYVVSRDLEPGATVNPGVPVLKLADPRTAWVTVHVDERDLGLLAAGDSAEISLRSRPGAPHAGRVVRIRRESDRVTEQLAVDVAFAEPPARLTLGEQVEALLLPSPRPGALAVPASALVRGPEGPGVWMVVDGRLRFAPVRIGAVGRDDWAEALHGLTARDRVVVAPGALADPRNEGRRVLVRRVETAPQRAARR